MKNKLYICAVKINNKWTVKAMAQNPLDLLGPEVVFKDEDGENTILWSSVQKYIILDILK